MDRAQRSSIAFAIVLILLGLWLMAVQFVPALQTFALNEFSWPFIIIAFGLFWLVMGLVTWTPGFLVPAAVFAGIGGLLYYQNQTGDWQSWAYAWTLIPGFVGVGVFFTELLQGRIRPAVVGGGWLVIISATLYLIFGSFLGGPNLLGPYWPVLIILLGVITLAQAFFRR
ncbi:MAG: hypothetical protein HZB51_04715 [Chloroflexi bacterium]|nr:hypothetical protein [Chloroflexota bacterium]